MSAEGSRSINSSVSAEDDWTSITDYNERRRVQNRIAQRRYRDKVRQQKQEAERQATDKRLAAGAYAAPDPDDLEAFEETGLPWGSFSLKHVVRTGQAREQSSRESSLVAAASEAGVASR